MTDNWFDFRSILNRDELLPGLFESAPPKGQDNVGEWNPDEVISAGKGGKAYNAHSYPTKVPPEAIEPFLNHYSDPGEIVLDPFCGSGMTGLAAKRTGRLAILNDLSTLALHLAFNHTHNCDPHELEKSWRRLQANLADEINRLYSVLCDDCHAEGQVRYTIWSDVYACPECDSEVPLWKVGVDRDAGKVNRRLQCPECGAEFGRSAKRRIRVEPAWLAYSCACSDSLRERDLTDAERDDLMSWQTSTAAFYPTRLIEKSREMYKRSALHLQDIDTISDFYTARNLEALALLWAAIGTVRNDRVRTALAFAFTNTAWHGTKMRRFNARGGHRPLTGTLYIPQLSSEANIFDVFGNKIAHLVRFYEEMQNLAINPPVVLNKGSATNLDWLEDQSVDYIFTDPPFGSNIFYADCNLIGEAWLGELTDPTLEAVVNRSKSPDRGGKTLEDYESLMEAAFREMHRVLKKGRWATVVFQSSDGDVWHAIERSAAAAGFKVESADILDKVQESMKGYKGRSGAENVASFDIILHLRKLEETKNSLRKQLEEDALRQFALERVAKHLDRLDSGASNRTLPYLYSLVIRELLNSGFSVNGFTMEGLRNLLQGEFEESEGLWWRSTSAGVAAG